MLKLYKYEATGNDFILSTTEFQNPKEVAIKTCDRHFGIGADGLMFPSPSTVYDVKMNYYNADGTIAPMCGNGIRAFVNFIKNQKLIEKDEVRVKTLAGLMTVSMKDELFEVNLGKPVTHLSYPDINDTQENLVSYTLQVNDVKVSNAYVFTLGTLHTVIFVDDLNQYDKIAEELCHHPFFPKRSNINFVKIIDKNHLAIKTYERGVGWTLSCGTGSSASQYLSYKLNLTDKASNIKVPGGELFVTVENEEVLLKGPAQLIASFEMEL